MSSCFIKKWILVVLLSLILTTAFAVGLSACNKGGESDQHTHTYSPDWSKDESYHWHAATCEHADEVSDKAAHTWDNGTITTAATHTTNGVMTYVCTVCGYERTETIPADSTAHTYSNDWSKDESYHWHSATCEHADEVSDKAAHTWDNGTITTAATHTTNGVMTYVCTVCGYERTETIPADSTAHTYSNDWSKDESYHWHASTCEHADEVSDYAAHTWDNGTITTAATHTTNGVMTYVCTVCGYERTETIPADSTAHTYSNDWSKDESYHWHSATCEHTDEVSDYAAHSWDNGTITSAATCKDTGVMTYTCTVCGYEKTETIEKTTTHTYGSYVSNGETTHTHTCSVCGQTETNSHNFDGGVITNAAACDETGIKTYTCTDCGQTKTETIEKTAHTWGAWTSNGDSTHTRTCSVCGQNECKSCEWEDNICSVCGHDAGGTHGLNWTLCGDTYYVSGIGSASGEVILPYVYNGLAVVSINDRAFYACSVLTGIIIPGSISSIGDSAFAGCLQLKSVNMNDGIVKIGNNAFKNCIALENVSVPGSVRWVGDDAFSGCSSLNYTKFKNAYYLGNSSESCVVLVKSIGTGINDCTVSDGATVICNKAFNNCISLKTVQIGTAVAYIGRYAFNSCTSLSEIDVGGWIDDYAFGFCTALAIVTFSDSVTGIGNNAFYMCGSLEKITIPDSVQYIGGYAFYGCTSLKCAIVDVGDIEIGLSVFDSCTGLCCAYVNVGRVSDYMFKDCISLARIKFGDSVKEIDSEAFSGCSSLGTVEIPNCVVSIGYRAFYGCTSLATISMGSGITEIIECAFENCTALTKIEIPASVEYIGRNAFAGCNSLTSVTLEDMDGWRVSNSSSLRNGAEMAIADASQAAVYLTDTYCGYYWYK